MIGRLVFYAVEALILAFVGTFALMAAVRGLRRLGLHVVVHWLRAYGIIWVGLLTVGVVGGEMWGPEFLAPYYAVGSAVCGCATIWVVSFPVSKHVRVIRRDMHHPDRQSQ